MCLIIGLLHGVEHTVKVGVFCKCEYMVWELVTISGGFIWHLFSKRKYGWVGSIDTISEWFEGVL